MWRDVKEKIKSLERNENLNFMTFSDRGTFIIVLKSLLLENTHDEKSKT